MVPTFYKKGFPVFYITSLQHSRNATIAAEIQLMRICNYKKEQEKSQQNVSSEV